MSQYCYNSLPQVRTTIHILCPLPNEGETALNYRVVNYSISEIGQGHYPCNDLSYAGVLKTSPALSPLLNKIYLSRRISMLCWYSSENTESHSKNNIRQAPEQVLNNLPLSVSQRHPVQQDPFLVLWRQSPFRSCIRAHLAMSTEGYIVHYSNYFWLLSLPTDLKVCSATGGTGLKWSCKN